MMPYNFEVITNSFKQVIGQIRTATSALADKLSGHEAAKNNPHKDTIENIGGVSKTDVDTAMAGKLDKSGTAVSSKKLENHLIEPSWTGSRIPNRNMLKNWSFTDGTDANPLTTYGLSGAKVEYLTYEQLPEDVRAKVNFGLAGPNKPWLRFYHLTVDNGNRWSPFAYCTTVGYITYGFGWAYIKKGNMYRSGYGADDGSHQWEWALCDRIKHPLYRVSQGYVGPLMVYAWQGTHIDGSLALSDGFEAYIALPFVSPGYVPSINDLLFVHHEGGDDYLKGF